MGTKQARSRTLFDLINLKIITKIRPFLDFFLGCFLVRTCLSWCLFSLKAAYAYPACKKWVVWDNISAPGVPCAPGHVVEHEKLALLLFGILTTTCPCGLWVEDFAGSLTCPLLNMEDMFVTNCGRLHHLQCVSVCQLVLDNNITGYLSVIIVSVSFLMNRVHEMRKEKILKTA